MAGALCLRLFTALRLGHAAGMPHPYALAFAALLALAAPAAAQTARHYDAAGRLVGRSERQGDTVRHYDPAGRLVGRDVARDSGRGRVEVREYDPAGRLIGRREGGRR
ncbi:hypothetical protein CR165_23425 [Pseudoroseomonas aestuarii]|uniref:Type IV secretion protein Rhs n=1 Tax=Teichococcus aestuarii TaxID=568898 RepID=A0A2U1UXM8_9PROT|nr:hypothetical protein CR165_23425 [Pseudoroseomonas aestuarii]